MDRQVGIFSIVGVLILSSKKLCLDINTGELQKKNSSPQKKSSWHRQLRIPFSRRVFSNLNSLKI